MSSPTRSRDRVLAELSRGPVTDKSGRATSKLFDLIQYTGSSTGLTSLLKQLETEGLIARSVNGKRCYEIRSTLPGTAPERTDVPPPTAPTSPPQTTDDGIDITRLAVALLDRVIEVAGRPERDATALSAAQGRVAELLEDNERMRKALRLAQDLAIARKVELDGLRMRLAELQRNLDKMTNGQRIDDRRLKELRDLAKLMTVPPSGKS